jgi:hypothetical protein
MVDKETAVGILSIGVDMVRLWGPQHIPLLRQDLSVPEDIVPDETLSDADFGDANEDISPLSLLDGTESLEYLRSKVMIQVGDEHLSAAEFVARGENLAHRGAFLKFLHEGFFTRKNMRALAPYVPFTLGLPSLGVLAGFLANVGSLSTTIVGSGVGGLLSAVGCMVHVYFKQRHEYANTRESTNTLGSLAHIPDLHLQDLLPSQDELDRASPNNFALLMSRMQGLLSELGRRCRDSDEELSFQFSDILKQVADLKVRTTSGIFSIIQLLSPLAVIREAGRSSSVMDLLMTWEICLQSHQSMGIVRYLRPQLSQVKIHWSTDILNDAQALSRYVDWLRWNGNSSIDDWLRDKARRGSKTAEELLK